MHQLIVVLQAFEYYNTHCIVRVINMLYLENEWKEWLSLS